MILEVVRPDGARTWHRLDALPLTLGRGYANDLIVDDPYLDARHARIAGADGGGLLVEDLGSVNGVVDGGAVRRAAAVAVRPGAAVRVGRTTLRFRALDEDVAPALVDAPAVDPHAERPAVVPAPAAAARRTAGRPPRRRRPPRRARSRSRRGSATPSARRRAACSRRRSASSSSPPGGRGRGRRPDACWCSASTSSAPRRGGRRRGGRAASGIVGEWLAFVFPDARAPEWLTSAVGFAVLAALVAAHLRLASAMPRRRRWTAGLAAAGVVYGIGGLAALAKDDEFSDVPTFSSALKPLPAAWLPTATVDDFGGVMRDVRGEVDAAAARARAGPRSPPTPTAAAPTARHGRP
jgi:pSer/pThr/pTyr-binding forkhead associated (FHA) protein